VRPAPSPYGTQFRSAWMPGALMQPMNKARSAWSQVGIGAGGFGVLDVQDTQAPLQVAEIF